MDAAPSPADADLRTQRQVIYWRLLAGVFGMTEQAPNIEQLTSKVVEKLDLPSLITEPNLSIDALLQRYPALKPDFESIRKVCNPDEKDKAEQEKPDAKEGEALKPADLRRSLAYSKLLLNTFGPNTTAPNVTAAQYGQWCQDVGRFEECFGYAPGALRGKRGAAAGGQAGATWGTGMGRLVSEEQLQAGLAAMEGDIIHRMALREVLKDDRMAAQLTPSMPLVEQLLRDKNHLSDNGPQERQNADSALRRSARRGAAVAGDEGR